MILDANVLLYAVAAESLHHQRAASWLTEVLNGDERVGFPWPTIGAFLRTSTHPRLYDDPVLVRHDACAHTAALAEVTTSPATCPLGWSMADSETRLGDATYLRHLREATQRFVDVLAPVAPDTRVPTCPEWTADDLLAHLWEVQTFWNHIVTAGVRTDEEAESLTPPARPEPHEALLAATAAAGRTLADTLESLPPQTPRWTWSAEQTVGFTIRRQAHEATIHRLDAELTAAPDGSRRTPIDATLAADGVDEALRVMYGGCPPWGTITPVPDKTLRIVATDTGTMWLVSLARFTGTDPDGVAHDDPDIWVADHDPGDGTVHPTAILTGAAEDLYCRLWHRPTITEPNRTGDLALLGEFEGIVSAPLR